MRVSTRAWSFVLWALLAVPAAAGAAPEQVRTDSRPAIAVLDFPAAPRLHAGVVEELQKRYNVLPLSLWKATAAQIQATSEEAEDIARVARALKLGAVVTAVVRKESDLWLVIVSARYGPTGKEVDRLSYPLRSPYTARQLMVSIAPAVENALHSAPVPLPSDLPPLAEQVPATATAGTPEGAAPPLAPLPPLIAEPPAPRPRWAPYVDAGAGLILGGRRLTFTEDLGASSPVHCYDFQRPALSADGSGQIVYQYGSQYSRCPGFASTVTSGLRLDATAFPLAGRMQRLLRGLGLGATLDIMFWPQSRLCDKNVNGVCQAPGEELSTSELRAELGLRWVWNLLGKRSRPSLIFMVQYGLHQFSLQKSDKTYEYPDPKTLAPTRVQGKDDHGLPDIRYQYLDLGAGARVPFYGNTRFYVGLLLDFHYHLVFDYGELQSQFTQGQTEAGLYQGGGYGPVSKGYGLRVGVTPIEWSPWRGLQVSLSAFYERFAMSFVLAADAKQWPPADRAPEDSARHLSVGATDQYYGGVLHLGYQY